MAGLQSEAQRLKIGKTAGQRSEGVKNYAVAEGERKLSSKIVVMDESQRVHDFWSRWGHEPNPSQEFNKFRVRMIEISKSIWYDYFRVQERLRELLALISGTPEGAHFYESGIYELLNKATTVFEVADAMRCLLRTVEIFPTILNDCCNRIQTGFELSPTIMIQLVRHGSTATLYPVGARLLDAEVVEGNLAWLSKFPAVAKPFENALKAYATKDPNQYRNTLDNLRFALEQMVRTVLNNEKSLEKQKPEFLAWLKKNDAHTHIGNMYHELLFDHFTKYQNAAVKHEEDKYTPAEVEFMLYAVGTFLRFIQRLLEQEASPKTTATCI
jgi:hypothetical protein